MELLQFVEELREPEPEAVVAELYGEVDGDHGEGDADDVGGEELPGLVQTLRQSLVPGQSSGGDDVRRDPLAEKASHGVLRPVTSGVGAEHHPQHGQALPLPALAEQELGGLR